MLAGITRKHARPPVQKEVIVTEYILVMIATLPYDLRGLRERAILFLEYAGGLRRSQIVSLDVHKDDTPDSGGVDKTWGSCGAFSVCDGQPTIENCGPCDGYSVSPFGRPPHPSALSHAGIGNVID